MRVKKILLRGDREHPLILNRSKPVISLLDSGGREENSQARRENTKPGVSGGDFENQRIISD